MSPALEVSSTILYAAAALVTASGLLWTPVRHTAVIVLKIAWLYFVTGTRG
jgi:hypothetical protein